MNSERVDSNQAMKGKPLLKVQIMVVDDDSTSLNVVSALLKACNDQDRMNIELGVFTVTSALEALATLRLRRGSFDLVVSDLHMPGMNGMELQKHVEEEFKLPVIIMSSDDKESVMLRTLEDGAAFYIVKPVKRNDLKNVWQFAVAAKKGKSIVGDDGTTKSTGETFSSSPSDKISHQDQDQDQDQDEDAYSSSSVNEGTSGNGKNDGRKTGKKRPKDDDDDEGADNPVALASKKAKVVWTNSLHNRFLQAISHIGLDKAVPKRILEFMSVPGLTRENVASHLQKYRMFLKRVAERRQNPPRNFSDRPSRTSFASSLTLDHIHHHYPQFSFQPQLQQPTFHPGLGFNASPPSRTGSTLGRPQQFPYDHHRASRSSFMSHSSYGESRILGSSSSSHSRPSVGSSNPLYRANPSGFGLESRNTRGGSLFSNGAVNRPIGLPMSATTNGSLNRENQLQRFKQDNLERLNRLSIVGTGTTPSNFRFGSSGITRVNPVSAIGNLGTSNISSSSNQLLSAKNNSAEFQVTSDGGLFESGAQMQFNRGNEMSNGIGNRGRISLLDWVRNDNSHIVGTMGHGSFGESNYPVQGSSSPPVVPSAWQRPKLPTVDQGNTSLLSPLPPSNSDMTNNAAAFNSMSDLKQRGTEIDLGNLFEANNSNSNHFVTNRRQGGEGVHRTNNLPNISFLSELDTPMTELLNSDFPAPFNFEANSSWTGQDTATLVQGGQAVGNTNSSGSATENPIESSYPTLGQGSGAPLDWELNRMFSAGNNNPTSGNTQGWGDEFTDSLFGDGPF